ncbi:MAG: hypothetical protein LBN05_07660 [Oscillospiraceae bacterium]|jgi:hypothetical protein|nr:hypothetical protein [Oscillospiraceae bacterium]
MSTQKHSTRIEKKKPLICVVSVFLVIVLITLALFVFKNPYSNYSGEFAINNGKLNVLSAIEAIENGQHIPQYDSDRSIVFKQADGTFAQYVFSSPVMFKTGGKYKFISNQIIDSKKKGFAYENEANSIKSYFPANVHGDFMIQEGKKELSFALQTVSQVFSDGQKLQHTNMYGDRVDAVSFSSNAVDVVMYPTKSGIRAEIIVKEKLEENSLQFKVTSSGGLSQKGEKGYVLFEADGEINSVIYQPITKTANGALSIDATIDCDLYDGENILNVTIPKEFSSALNVYPLKLDMSFELYVSSTPDSSVYSKFKDNSYLRNYAVLGNHPTLGEGWDFMRLGVPSSLAKGQNAPKVTLHIPTLSIPNDTALELYDVNGEWASADITWETKLPESALTPYAKEQPENNYLTFDISNFILASQFVGIIEQEISRGFVLRYSAKDDFAIIASNDNVLYPSFTKTVYLRM